SSYKCDFPDVQQTCTASGNLSTVKIYLTEKRSGMRWPVKLKGYVDAEVWNPGGVCNGWSTQIALANGTGYQCKSASDGYIQHLASAKPMTL
ncbi:CfaE/CblD family pilus tip adhesin, partial [Escherichia coli]